MEWAECHNWYMIERQTDRLLHNKRAGSWANGQNCTVNPIHVALLPSGRIFYLAGSGYSTAQQFGHILPEY